MTVSGIEPDQNHPFSEVISPDELSDLAPWSLAGFAACCLRRASEFALLASNRAPGNLSNEIEDALTAALHLTAGPPFPLPPQLVKEKAIQAADLIVSKSRSDTRHIDSRYDDTAPDEDAAYDTVAAAARVAASVADVVEAAVELKSPVPSALEVAKRLYKTARHCAGSQNYWPEDYQRALKTVDQEVLKDLRRDIEFIRNSGNPGNEISKFCCLRLDEINNALYISLNKNPLLLYELSPRKFEELIADLLLNMGCEVQLTPITRDGGRDVLAKAKTPFGELLFIVECKRFRPDRKVGIDIVERFLYVLDRKDNASCGLIATTSFFSPEARTTANQLQYRLKLRDFDGLREWIGNYGKWKQNEDSMLWTPTVLSGSLFNLWQK